MNRSQIYDKYYTSDIFNTNPPAQIKVNKVAPKVSINHPNFSQTRDEVFNVPHETRIKRSKQENQPLERNSQSAIRRRKVYDKLYGSDIFNRERPGSMERRHFGGLERGNNRNTSTCMEGMKNNEEYVRDLKDYEGEHRTAKKEYNVDIYINRETPAERYYRDHYDMHGAVILPESNYNSQKNQDAINRANYAHNKKLLNKEMKKLNDCGADKKHPGGNSVNYPENVDLTNKFGKKKFDWMDNSKNQHHYVDPRNNPNSCQINKQIHLASNVFNNEPNKYDNVNEINNRIEHEKNRVYNIDVLGNPKKKYNNINNNQENDRSLLGAVHTRWGKTNIDWRSPEAEIMFGKEFNDGINQNYGPKGPTAFQRKLNQLADTKNIDTISGNKHDVPIVDIQRPLKNEEINGAGSQQMDEVVKNIPNLNEGQKLGIKMKMSALDFEGKDWENKAKTMSDFYTKNPYGVKKGKQDVTGKVNERNFNIKNDNNIDFHDYVITYGTKGNQFEKYDENDIKRMFGMKGVQVYDIQRNPFGKGDYNTVKFKVRYDENNSDVMNNKIQSIEDDLNKQNYRLKIEKEEEKNFKKNDRNFVGNPGAKIGIMVEPGNADSNAKYKMIPNNIRQKKGFSKQFANMNYQYKKNNP